MARNPPTCPAEKRSLGENLVNDGRMWCSVQVWLRMDCQGDSISLCEILPGIGWRVDYMQPPVPQISAFSLRRKCGWEYSDRNAEKSLHSYMEKMRKKMWRKRGENADGSIWTGTRRNLRILIWKKNAEEMRMGVFGQECGEISALYPRFSHNTEITRTTSPHSQFSAPQP